MELTPQARELLNGPNFGVIGTVNQDGSAQLSVVWVKERDGDILFSTVEGRAKTRNLQRNPSISVLVLDTQNAYRYSELRGTARIDPDPPGALIRELSLKYTGEQWVEGAKSPRVIVAVTPEHITEHD